MKIITYWKTLMIYAKELGEARKSGNKDRIKKAEDKHDSYKECVLMSDKMIIT